MTAVRVFINADLHFGQPSICTFLRADGSKLRPWDRIEDHDAALIERWNSVVRPQDKVYVLGDVAMHRRAVATIAQCHGKKHLVKGNHDTHKLSIYTPHFYNISAYRVLAGFILSHVPIHPASIGRFRGNIHGHIHDRVLDDPRYRCVSVEQTDYTPVLLDQLLCDSTTQ